MNSKMDVKISEDKGNRKFIDKNNSHIFEKIDEKIYKNEETDESSDMEIFYDKGEEINERNENFKTDDDEFSDVYENEKESDQVKELFDELEERDFEIDEFSKAINEKNNCLIDSLIERNGILLKTFSSNRTFLHIAAERGTVENVLRICKLGANVNIPNNKGETPIFHAAVKNSVKMIKILIDYGANVNITSKKGVNPLHLVLLHGSEETVRIILIKAFSEISSIFNNASTDLSCLFENLLKHKNSLNLQQNDYPLLIFFAAKIEDYEILELILRDCRDRFIWSRRSEQCIEKQKKDGIFCWKCKCTRRYVAKPPHDLNFHGHLNITALHYAVKEQLSNVVLFLLKEGADPNCRTLHNWTPLHYAAFLGNEEICQMLLNFGADVNVNFGWKSPLQQACGRINMRSCHNTAIGYYHDEFPFLREKFIFNTKVITKLIRSGANMECRNDTGMTPLLEACKAGHVEMVGIFLKSGANLRAEDDESNTALHYAAIGNSLKIVDILLKFGLHVDVQNNDGYTPLMFMIQYGEKKFSMLPLIHDKFSQMSKNVEMVEYLVQRGANLDTRNNDGATALHVAIIHDLPDLVLTLLELGADRILKDYCDSRNRYIMGSHTFPIYQTLSRNVLVSQIAFKEDDYRPYYTKWCFNRNQLAEAVNLFKQSKHELEHLKSTVIFKNKSITYYDFLSRDLVTAASFVKSPEIMNKLSASACRTTTKFPIYSYFIGRRFKRIEILEKCVTPIVKFLSNYGKNKLPVEIVGMIINYLCWRDVQVFSRVLLKIL